MKGLTLTWRLLAGAFRKLMPLGPLFFGGFLLAGGVGILLPKTRSLAVLWSGIMIVLWVLLLHIPRALADLHNAGETSGVCEALALSGVAFILADVRRDREIVSS
jgi:hypothetical protein